MSPFVYPKNVPSIAFCLFRVGSSREHFAPPSHAHCSRSLSWNQGGFLSLQSCRKRGEVLVCVHCIHLYRINYDRQPFE
jgi:hypothetical protein